MESITKELFVIDDKLNRLERLFSLIGRDEFRNYALSLIEENLIKQANLELENLCQGRYQNYSKTQEGPLGPRILYIR